MTIFVEAGHDDAYVVLADETLHIDDGMRTRICRDDGERYESLSTARGQQRFEASRVAAYLALERIGAADARLAPSEPRHAPTVAWPKGVTLSISHTSGIVAAVARIGGPVGIDIEHQDRQLHDPRLVSIFCSSVEREQLNSWPDSRRRRILVDLWTGKEALTKSWGLGLAHDFRQLHLGIDYRGQIVNDSVRFFTFREWRVCIAASCRKAEAI